MSDPNHELPAPTDPRDRPPTVPAEGGGERPVVSSPHWAPPRPAGSHPVTALDPIAFLQAFRRRWVAATAAGLLCGLAAAAATWMLVPPVKYVARATLEVKSYLPQFVFPTGEVMPDAGTFKQTQLALIKSRYILEPALGRKEVATLPSVLAHALEDPVEWLEKELQASYHGGSDILLISLSGDRPADLSAVLSAVVDTYVEKVVEGQQKERLERLDRLKKLSDRYQAQLKDRRKTLQEMVDKAGSSSPDTLALQQQFALENLATARREGWANRSNIQKLEVELKLLEAKALEPARGQAGSPPAAGAGVSTVPAGLADDPGVRELQARIAKLNGQIQHIKPIIRNPSDPALVRSQRELAAVHKQLVDRFARLRNVTERARAVADPLALTRERLVGLKLFDEALKVDIEQFEKEAAVGKQILPLEAEEETVKERAKVAGAVLSAVERLDVELAWAPPRIEIRDKARTPVTKDDSKRGGLIAAAGLGGFALVLAGITLLEYRAQRIGSVDEVVHQVGLRLVGTVPALNRRRRSLPRHTGADHWENQLVESVDATGTLLLHAARAEGIRVVMVTSALQGEGKSSLASQLAAALARAGRRTLFVDCDLRRPVLARLFELPEDPGLCEVLRGELDALDVIRATSAERLFVLTAGHRDALALQFLAQDGARALFDSLLADFDFLVVDSAPVLPVADTLRLGQQVDAVIFAILRDVSRVPQVRAAYGRLSELGVRTLGAVVNGVSHPTYGYYKSLPADS